jgi:ACDE family multidrug resistance protein
MQTKSSHIGLNPNLLIVFAVTLTGIMGVSSVTPILPTVAYEFNLSPEQSALLITVFTLPGVFLTPVFGILADWYGRRRVLVPVLTLFGLAGTACFYAQEFSTLLILRTLQGIGAASLGAMNVTIISDLFRGQERTTALGYNSAVLSIGATLYPAIGGSLALLGWRYPFLLPILAFPTAMLVLLKLDSPKNAQSDDIRAYFRAVFRSLRSRKIRTMFLLSTTTFLLLYGPLLTFLPFYMANRFSSDSLTIGIVLATSAIGNVISGASLGRLVKRFTSVELLLISYLVYAFALAIIPFMPEAYWLVVPSMLFGFGIGINNPNVQTLIAKTVRPEQRAAILSINGMVLRLGQTIGPLLMAFLFAVAGPDGSYWVMSAMALAIFAWLRSMVR